MPTSSTEMSEDSKGATRRRQLQRLEMFVDVVYAVLFVEFMTCSLRFRTQRSRAFPLRWARASGSRCPASSALLGSPSREERDSRALT
jgi:hypothetical protein